MNGNYAEHLFGIMASPGVNDGNANDTEKSPSQATTNGATKAPISHGSKESVIDQVATQPFPSKFYSTFATCHCRRIARGTVKITSKLERARTS